MVVRIQSLRICDKMGETEKTLLEIMGSFEQEFPA